MANLVGLVSLICVNIVLPGHICLFWMNRVDLDSIAVKIFCTDKVSGNLIII